MTYYPDMQRVQDGPTDFDFRVVNVDGRLGHPGTPFDARRYAVGWIGNTIESRGETPEDCIRILFDAYEAGHRFRDGMMGAHMCEVCPSTSSRPSPLHPVAWKGRTLKLYGHGHHRVLHGRSLFICPSLILHYIVDHQYLPPAPFIDAVLHGTILVPAKVESGH